MEASKRLLDFWAVFVFRNFLFFQKYNFLALTYPEFILRISKPCHISIPVLVEILLSILAPQEHLKAGNVMDRLPWPEERAFTTTDLSTVLPCLYACSRVSLQGLSCTQPVGCSTYFLNLQFLCWVPRLLCMMWPLSSCSLPFQTHPAVLDFSAKAFPIPSSPSQAFLQLLLPFCALVPLACSNLGISVWRGDILLSFPCCLGGMCPLHSGHCTPGLCFTLPHSPSFSQFTPPLLADYLENVLSN